MADSTRERILKILRGCRSDFREDAPLNRQLDSLTLMLLVGRLEAEFGIKIASMELVPSIFESVATLESLVDGKSGRP